MKPRSRSSHATSAIHARRRSAAAMALSIEQRLRSPVCTVGPSARKVACLLRGVNAATLFATDFHRPGVGGDEKTAASTGSPNTKPEQHAGQSPWKDRGRKLWPKDRLIEVPGMRMQDEFMKCVCIYSAIDVPPPGSQFDPEHVFGSLKVCRANDARSERDTGDPVRRLPIVSVHHCLAFRTVATFSFRLVSTGCEGPPDDRAPRT